MSNGVNGVSSNNMEMKDEEFFGTYSRFCHSSGLPPSLGNHTDRSLTSTQSAKTTPPTTNGIGDSSNKTQVDITKVQPSSQSIFAKVGQGIESVYQKGFYQPACEVGHWYWNNLPKRGILQGAVKSTLISTMFLKFATGNLLHALIGGLVLNGLTSVVHSLSMPLIKTFYLLPSQNGKMTVSDRLVTALAVAISIGLVMNLLAIFFPMLELLTINVNFTVIVFLIKEVIDAVEKFISKHIVDLNHPTKEALTLGGIV